MKKRILSLILVTVMCLSVLCSCGNDFEEVEIPAGQSVMVMKYDQEAISPDSDIYKNNSKVGSVSESGIMDVEWNFEIEGEKFTAKFGNNDNLCSYAPTGTTYVFYDSSNNVVGYSQLTLEDQSYYLFYDGNGNEKEFYMPESDLTFYQFDGTAVGGVSYDYKTLANKYDIKINYYNDSKLDNKVLMTGYILAEQRINDAN